MATRPESPPECQRGRLSPRFLSILTEGDTGEGLLRRAFAEAQRRAYESWQQRPWMSAEENWLAAERSFVRGKTLQEADPKPSAAEGHQKSPADPGETSKSTNGSTSEQGASGALTKTVEAKSPELPLTAELVANHRAMPTASLRSLLPSEISTDGETPERTLSESESSPFSIPKLPLNLVRSSRSTGAVRAPTPSSQPGSARSDSAVLWPGTIMELPPWPAPPEQHPLITPRTGAQKKDALRLTGPSSREFFSMYTPRPGGAQVPSPIESRSPSQTSEGSLMDAYENWERIGSIETTTSQHDEVVMTRRSEKTTERSNFSLCQLYGQGQDAEVRVLRKVICDLEARLQEQEQELRALRSAR